MRKAVLFGDLFFSPPISEHYELKICRTIEGELIDQGYRDLTERIPIIEDADDWNSTLDELIEQLPLNIAFDRLPKDHDKTILSTAMVNEIHIVTNDGPLLLLAELAAKNLYEPGEFRPGSSDFEKIIIEAHSKKLLSDQQLRDFVKRSNVEGPSTKKEYNHFFRQFE